MKLEIQGQKVNLLPQHALYLEDLDILAIADVNFAKFEDLERILRLVRELQPESLYIIGNFIHDVKGFSPDLVEEIHQWRKELNCAVVLLEASHDRHIQPHLLEWNIVLAQSMTVENFVFSHEPSKPDKPGQVVVSGHIHPTILLETDQDPMRLPCFVWEESQLILPSFGSAKDSGVNIRRREVGRYFSVTQGQVIEV